MTGLCGSGRTLIVPAQVPDDVPAQTGAGETDYNAGLPYPVEPENVTAEDRIPFARGWWPGATANQEYIDPSVGGQAGIPHALGWRTGLGIRRMFTSPITGRTLVPPATRPNPRQGPVGFSSYQDNLYLGVRSQSLVPPTVDQVNAAVLAPVVVTS
jgi:hypothetical protein